MNEVPCGKVDGLTHRTECLSATADIWNINITAAAITEFFILKSEDGDSAFLRNICSVGQDYTASQRTVIFIFTVTVTSLINQLLCM
jgi:hypothetical protein